MPALTTVNPQIVDAVQRSNESVLKDSRATGSSVAYQHVAQSTAIAIQDAAEYLRNIAAISTATNGVALGMIIAGQNADKATEAIVQAQKALSGAVEVFQNVGQTATTILQGFPSK
ncbi:hypothetical protein [Archangium violaceum]|uniref:hypothetical protein n=1 Tax=Archangium violaceum TaxID=83451 RepID=UPI000698EB7A|nr:hypothetical protein [Archangium violaceum]